MPEIYLKVLNNSVRAEIISYRIYKPNSTFGLILLGYIHIYISYPKYIYMCMCVYIYNTNLFSRLSSKTQKANHTEKGKGIKKCELPVIKVVMGM